MHRKKAAQLLFGTGTPVRIRTEAGDERIILNKEVRTEQILKLLAPISGINGQSLLEDGPTEFSYEAPTGGVRVRATTLGDRMTAVVIPQDKKFDDEAESPDDVSQLFGQTGADLGGGFGMDVSPGMPPELQGPPVALSGPASAIMPSMLSSSFDNPPLSQIAGKPITPRPEVESVPGEPKINRVLRSLVQGKGSDLHLTATHAPFYRRDGDMQKLPGWENHILTSEEIHGWMAGVATEAVIAQFDETGDADFAHEIEGVARFRMNWFRDRFGDGAVMRTIPSEVLTADQLNLPQVIRSFCELPKGLVVVTGPTGSGKSTTLAGMVDLINKTRSDHIITVEDPVEFVHRSQKCLVNQREVHTHTESFASALRAALREDPDIVLVGEMRDLETVHIAIETAETGHLVFGTLHTNTAPSTVDRIIDQFPTDHQAQIRVMLSESLKGVVAQVLCKKVGGGRVACLEVMVVNNAISNLIREGKTFQIPSMMQTAKGIGMRTQIDAMVELVKSGLVDPDEGYRKAVDQPAMKLALGRAGFKVTED